MFENGGVTKLNDEVIEKLSKLFNIEVKTVEPASEVCNVPPSVEKVTNKGFCPNPHCPSNHAYQVDGKTFMLPDRTAADPVGGKFCALCGEVLERVCPNCGAPVHEGAVCSHCGDAYVAVCG